MERILKSVTGVVSPLKDVAKLEREIVKQAAKEDLNRVRRLAIVGGTLAALAVTGLCLLLTGLGALIAEYFEFPIGAVVIIEGVILLAVGGVLGVVIRNELKHSWETLEEVETIQNLVLRRSVPFNR